MVNCVSTAAIMAVMFIEIQYMVEKLIVVVVNNTNSFRLGLSSGSFIVVI